MPETINLNINGKMVKAEPGMSVLEAANNSDIYIPSICYYKGLKPLPEVSPDLACQLCLVEIEGKIVLSCETKAVPGMIVKTETPQIQELRRRSLTDILRRHPNDCLSCWRRERCKPFDICLRSVSIQERCLLCPANKQCEVQRAVDYVGINELPPTISKQLPVREDSPFFTRDHNLCINCERCVRVCADVRKAKVIEFAYPCHKACPAGIDIPRYIKAVGRNRPGTALAVIREKVPFPGVLGRVCIHPCEGECQRGKIAESPLQIRMLKRYAADHGDESWKKMARHAPPTGKKVAVVGAGPAGLTAAYYLAKAGHMVTVFESQPKPGGMMLLGIPEYRLPRNVLDNEIKEITSAGVEIKLNAPVKEVDSLLNQGYNAVFLGLGAHQGMKLGVDGENLPGVMESVEFLRRGNLGEKVNVGERVGVVGGGNVAIDAARMSLRFGAKKVVMFYRRTRSEMPAADEEVEAALAEGVEILYLTAPAKVTRENNTVKFYCTKMKLGEPDASGRPRPVPIENSEFVTELDTLLVAIGQRPDVSADFKVELGRGNTVKTDNSMMTTRPGVFSAGDCVSGPASVIGAIAGGRKAAEAIDRYLGGKGDISESLVLPEESTEFLKEGIPAEKLAKTTHLAPQKSVSSFEEVEQGWSQETAVAESQRCLRCYVITPKDNKVLQDANCQFCGACVDACPTGALMERTAAFLAPAAKTTSTTCPYCGVGCNLNLEVKDDKITRVVPGDGPANHGQACVKGKFGLDFVRDPNRLTTPLIKKNGKFEPASWDEAISLIASKMKDFKSDEVAVIASAKCTNEENYLIQKFARVVLGTNNIDHCARLCHSPTVAGLLSSFGSGAMTNSINDLSQAKCILAIGSNTTAAHPVIGLEVNEAVQRGAKLIVANPRNISLCKFADTWLRLKPGSDVALLMGMMKVIVDENLYDKDFVKDRCENFEAFTKSLEKYPIDLVEKLTGIPKDLIIKAARMFATVKPAAVLYAMGITQSSHGTDNVMATANLVMLTGNIGKPGSGLNPLRGQNNVQGSCDMGCLPGVFTGYQNVTDPKVREKFETAWGCKLDPTPGLTLPEIFGAAHSKKIKSVFLLVGENPLISEPTMKHMTESLESLDFLVVQDIFLSETAQFAHVVLPAASFAEKDGTFTNTERRVQRVRKAMEPIGQSKSDWEIIRLIAQKMGKKGFDYANASQIMDEIASVTPSYGGISYNRLENESLQWPCPTAVHPGTPILHTQIFTRGKGQFMPLEYRPPAEVADDQYPLILTTERSLYQYHTGTMSRKAAGLNSLKGREEVEINPADASALGIVNGDMVRVSSRRGAVTARAMVTPVSPVGVVSMTFHFAETPTNAITSDHLDPVSKIPELKVAAVRVEKLTAEGK